MNNPEKKKLLKQLRAIDAGDMRATTPAQFRRRIKSMFTQMVSAGKRMSVNEKSD